MNIMNQFNARPGFYYEPMGHPPLYASGSHKGPTTPTRPLEQVVGGGVPAAGMDRGEPDSKQWTVFFFFF